MDTHPCFPLTPDNEAEYRRLNEARAQLATATDINERAASRLLMRRRTRKRQAGCTGHVWWKAERQFQRKGKTVKPQSKVKQAIEREEITATALYAILGNEWIAQNVGGDLFEYQKQKIKAAFVSLWYAGALADYRADNIAEVYEKLTMMPYAEIEEEIAQDINDSCAQNKALLEGIANK